MHARRRPRCPLAGFVVVAALPLALVCACSPNGDRAAGESPAASAPNSSSQRPIASLAALASPTVTAASSSGLPAQLNAASTDDETPAATTPSRTPTTSPSPPPTQPPTPSSRPASRTLPTNAYVDVSVATLWHSTSSPRAVDAPAIAQPAAMRSWLSAMSLSQRLALNGRVDSQLLLGERVVVDRERGSWAHVVVPNQPTPLDARGYPGWIPLAQLTFRVPSATATSALVSVPTAWVYDGGTKVLEVSMATRLPVLAVDATWVHSELPDGKAVSIRRADVAVSAPGVLAFPSSGADVVRMAELFKGLPYLWGGTSGFGFDCSGFTHLVYLMHGVTIPRDADAQARAGTPVARSDLAPGDLVFFAHNHVVHHVGIYIGNNLMLHAPQTGSVVSVVSLSAEPYASEYAGAERYFH